MRETAELAELFAKGLPPSAGGVLEQVDAFVSASRLWWGEQERAKRMLTGES